MNSKPQKQSSYLLQLVIQNNLNTPESVDATSYTPNVTLMTYSRSFRLFLLMRMKKYAKRFCSPTFFSPHSSFVKSQIRWEKVLLKHSWKSFGAGILVVPFCALDFSTWVFLISRERQQKISENMNRNSIFFLSASIKYFFIRALWRSALVKHWQLTKGCWTFFACTAVVVTVALAGSNNHFLSN